MSDTTEKSILSSIPDLDDNTPDTGDDTAQGTTATEADDDTAAPFAADKATTATGTVDAANSGSGTTDAPAQPAVPVVQGIVRRDRLVEVPNKDNPATRDLVNPQTGEIVARGGAERRYFEATVKLHRENNTLTQRLQTAEANANHANEIVKLGTTLNLQPQDQSAALNLMSQFLKDPVKMLEALVVEVKSKGYQIPFLETGVTPGMDTAAIQRMVDARMAPITDAQKAQQQATEVQTNARVTLDKFLDENPEGEHNLGVLAQMMNSEPGLTIQSAHVKLIKWCAVNGYDFSQPLQPQVEARRAQPATQPATVTAQTTPRTPTPPLPNGRQTNGAVPVESAAKFDENASWSDIIRQAAKESGFRSVN